LEPGVAITVGSFTVEVCGDEPGKVGNPAVVRVNIVGGSYLPQFVGVSKIERVNWPTIHSKLAGMTPMLDPMLSKLELGRLEWARKVSC
jgi:hypothetical protein